MEQLPSASFDWIFFAIVAPWPIIALWLAFRPADVRPPATQVKNRL